MLAHAFLWGYSYERLKLAQFLGRHGVFLTCRRAETLRGVEGREVRRDVLGDRRGAAHAGRQPSHGRHCRSTRSLTATDCHSLGIFTVILLPMLSLAVKMTVPPWAMETASARRPAAPQTPGPAASSPRVRSHRRLRNRGTDSLSESGMKRMRGGAMRQCDRALSAPSSTPRSPRPSCRRSGSRPPPGNAPCPPERRAPW